MIEFILNNKFQLLFCYLCIAALWAIHVFITRDELYLKEKLALTIFWPINVLLWLIISVPKYFIKNIHERIFS